MKAITWEDHQRAFPAEWQAAIDKQTCFCTCGCRATGTMPGRLFDEPRPSLCPKCLKSRKPIHGLAVVPAHTWDGRFEWAAEWTPPLEWDPDSGTFFEDEVPDDEPLDALRAVLATRLAQVLYQRQVAATTKPWWRSWKVWHDPNDWLALDSHTIMGKRPDYDAMLRIGDG